MIIQERNGFLRIQRKEKFQPFKALVFGAIAGTIVGVISEEVGAGIAVFLLISFFGSVLILVERLDGFRQIDIDFESKTLNANNTLFMFPMRSLNIEKLDIHQFSLTIDPSGEEMFRKYRFNCVHQGEIKHLVVIPGKEFKEELTNVFQKYGVALPLKIKKVGKFVITE